MPKNPDSRRNAQSIGVLIAFVIIVIFFFGLYNNASTVPPSPVSSPPSPVADDKSLQPSQSPSTFARKDVTKQIQDTVPQDVRALVIEAEDRASGLIVYTTIVNPRGENGSWEAMQALRICNGIARGGEYEHISLKSADRRSFVFYGRPVGSMGECVEY